MHAYCLVTLNFKKEVVVRQIQQEEYKTDTRSVCAVIVPRSTPSMMFSYIMISRPSRWMFCYAALVGILYDDVSGDPHPLTTCALPALPPLATSS